MRVIFEYKDEEVYYHHSLDKSPDPNNFQMHAHDMCEIFYFVSGDAHYMVEGSEYRLEPGSILIMRPAETHKLQLLSNAPYERYSIHFAMHLLHKLGDPEGILTEAFYNRPIGYQNLYTRTDFRSGFVRDCLDNMGESSSRDYNRKLAILSYLYPILQELRKSFLQKEQEPSFITGQNIAKELVRYINNNLMSDELSLDTLSNHFLMSKCHLNRIFKQATGSTIWDYVLIKRLLAARQMLRSGKPAHEVCYACGFNDYSAFYRRYKNHYRVTPREDRLRQEFLADGKHL